MSYQELLLDSLLGGLPGDTSQGRKPLSFIKLYLFFIKYQVCLFIS
nr:MAG TPA: hypothetical protein [Caudoviricetes sp.]